LELTELDARATIASLAGSMPGLLQVWGVNVCPERVAETIRSHPDVTDCKVRLMRPDEGTRLKAFVVLEEPEDGAIEDNGDARRELKRPASLTFGAGVPRNEQGKVADWP
jgi:acyl-coenzyme A synthetase/AMP-(fatty) acid ligase